MNRLVGIFMFGVFFGISQPKTPLMKDGEPLEIRKKLLYSDFYQNNKRVKTLPVLLRNPASRRDEIISQVFLFPAIGFTANGLVWASYASAQPLFGEKINQGMLYFGIGSVVVGIISWLPFRHYADKAAERYNQGIEEKIGIK